MGPRWTPEEGEEWAMEIDSGWDEGEFDVFWSAESKFSLGRFLLGASNARKTSGKAFRAWKEFSCSLDDFGKIFSIWLPTFPHFTGMCTIQLERFPPAVISSWFGVVFEPFLLHIFFSPRKWSEENGQIVFQSQHIIKPRKSLPPCLSALQWDLLQARKKERKGKRKKDKSGFFPFQEEPIKIICAVSIAFI